MGSTRHQDWGPTCRGLSPGWDRDREAAGPRERGKAGALWCVSPQHGRSLWVLAWGRDSGSVHRR